MTPATTLRGAFATALIALAAAALLAAAPAHADDGVEMHRLYNPGSGEHFYTADVSERDGLVALGWAYEGVGWKAPADSGAPVYRLYNAFAGDHHYTMSAEEREALVGAGWTYESVGWRSADEGGVPLYRQFNPYATAGSHNYTASKDENDYLASVGWSEEGVAWYGLAGRWVEEQGHYEDIYETVHVPAVTHEEPVYSTVVDQEAYTTYTRVYYTQDGWSGTDLAEARAHHLQAGGEVWWEDVPEEHPAVTHQEQTGTTTVVDVPAHDEQQKTGSKWVVDVPGHWE